MNPDMQFTLAVALITILPAGMLSQTKTTSGPLRGAAIIWFIFYGVLLAESFAWGLRLLIRAL